MYFCDHWWLMAAHKREDSFCRCYESAREIRMLGFSDQYQKSHAISYDRRQLVRLITNASIASYRNPTTLTNASQPFLVRTIRAKVVTVSFDCEAARNQNVGERIA